MALKLAASHPSSSSPPSSPLSSLGSYSPSPPPSLVYLTQFAYPSPPASQENSSNLSSITNSSASSVKSVNDETEGLECPTQVNSLLSSRYRHHIGLSNPEHDDSADRTSQLIDTIFQNTPTVTPHILSQPSPKLSSLSTVDTSTPPPSSCPVPDTQPVKDETTSSARRNATRRREAVHIDLRESSSVDPAAQSTQLEALLKVLRKKRKIVIIAGAGISVSAGIPDFRSPSGLFQSLRSKYKLKSSGKDLFDASVYSQDSTTSTFHHMVRRMSEQIRNASPTLFHHLIASIAQEGRLLRLYSQNVDGIDAGMTPLSTKVPLEPPWPKTIQLHGGLEKMVCSKCHTLSNFESSLFDGPEAPKCKHCEDYDFARTTVAGKRSHGVGRLRPRMVLYNERNPDDLAIGSVSTADLRARPDALIVVGTSLRVIGIKRLAKQMAAVVRSRKDGVNVWINLDSEPVSLGMANCWDIIVRGPCDEVARLAGLKRWNDPSRTQETSNVTMRAPSQSVDNKNSCEDINVCVNSEVHQVQVTEDPCPRAISHLE